MNNWSLRAGNCRTVVRATCAMLCAVPALAPSTGAQGYRAVPGLRIMATGANNPAAIGSVSSAVRLSNGSVVIADNTNLQLHFFTANGRYVRSVGRDGVAPGQFRAVRWVGECGRDSVYAFDSMQNRISVFGADGQLARTFPSPNAQTVITRCGVDGTMAYVTAGNFAGTSSHGVVQTYSPSGKLLFRSRELLLDEGRPLGKSIKVSISDNTLIYGVGDSAFVTMMTAAGTARTKLPVGVVGRAPTDVNRTTAIDYWATYLKTTASDFARLRTFIASLPPVKTLPAYTEVFLDDLAKAVWIQTSVLGDPTTVLQRVGLDGTSQGSVSLLPNLMVQQIRGDVLVAKMTNAISGDESVVTYRLVATPGR